MNKKKVLMVIIVICIAFSFVSGVSAAKVDAYHIVYHKHTYS
ncbi:hypothetical protein [Methanobrevibacter arboriphilus]|nr:hypothetical protein [Methanobrevibacter arboriphilus]